MAETEHKPRGVEDIRKEFDGWTRIFDMLKEAQSADVNASILPLMTQGLKWYFDADILLKEIGRLNAELDVRKQQLLLLAEVAGNEGR